MQKPLTANQIGLSIVYAISLIPIAFLLDWGLYWFLDNTLYPLLNWFNHLKTVWKIFILFAGGGAVVTFASVFVNMLVTKLLNVVFKNLSNSSGLSIFSFLLFAFNSFIGIRAIYFEMPSWSLWFILEFILLCLLVLGLNFSLLYIVNRKKLTEE